MNGRAFGIRFKPPFGDIIAAGGFVTISLEDGRHAAHLVVPSLARSQNDAFALAFAVTHLRRPTT